MCRREKQKRERERERDKKHICIYIKERCITLLNIYSISFFRNKTKKCILLTKKKTKAGYMFKKEKLKQKDKSHKTKKNTFKSNENNFVRSFFFLLVHSLLINI